MGEVGFVQKFELGFTFSAHMLSVDCDLCMLSMFSDVHLTLVKDACFGI